MNDWDHIRFFLAVAKHGSLTKAAEELKVNHSTITRRIKKFEDQCGVRLFNKTPKGYALTEEGIDLLAIAKEMSQYGEIFFRRLKGHDNKMTGKITVTMPHEIYDFFLYKPVNDFIEKHPQIEIDLLVGKNVKNIALQEADIAIRVTPKPPEYLIGRKIVDLSYNLYARKSLQFNEDTPVITWVGENNLPAWTKSLHNPKIRLRVDDLQSMYVAVKSGAGIARMPTFIHNLINDEDVMQIDKETLQSAWSIWVLNHVDMKNTKRVRVFRDFIIDYFLQNKFMFV